MVSRRPFGAWRDVNGLQTNEVADHGQLGSEVALLDGRDFDGHGHAHAATTAGAAEAATAGEPAASAAALGALAATDRRGRRRRASLRAARLCAARARRGCIGTREDAEVRSGATGSSHNQTHQHKFTHKESSLTLV